MRGIVGHDCRRLKTHRSAHSAPVGTTGPLVAPVPTEADSATAYHDLVPATGILVAVGISTVLWIVVGLVLFLGTVEVASGRRRGDCEASAKSSSS